MTLSDVSAVEFSETAMNSAVRTNTQWISFIDDAQEYIKSPKTPVNGPLLLYTWGVHVEIFEHDKLKSFRPKPCLLGFLCLMILFVFSLALTKRNVEALLRDDFDTVGVVHALQELVRVGNIELDPAQKKLPVSELVHTQSYMIVSS